jgi:hypothetical protein
MQVNNFALRLPHSMYDAVRQAAADDGVAINQYINVAVAEKLACRRTAQQFLDARAQGGSAKRALDILAKAGSDVAEV